MTDNDFNIGSNTASSPKNPCADSSTPGITNAGLNDEQYRVLNKLKAALQASELPDALSYFKLYSIATDAEIQSGQREPTPESTRVMLRLKKTSDALCSLSNTFNKKEIALLDGLQMGDLLVRGKWLQLILDHANGLIGSSTIDAELNRIQSIYQYQPMPDTVAVSASDSAGSSQFVSSGDQAFGLKQNRLIAVLAFCSGTLIVGLLLTLVLLKAPNVLDAFKAWTTAEPIAYRSLVVCLLFLLSVLVFQLTTRVVFASAAATNTMHTEAVTSLFGDMFTFNASGRRMLAGCMGPLLLGFGTGVSTTAGFGAFGVTVMLDGLYHTYGVPFWVSQFFLTVCCYAAAWYWARIPLGLGTIPDLLLIGPAISFAAWLTPAGLPFIWDLVAFIGGTVVFAFGIALCASAELGPDGKTALSLAAEKINQWPIPQSAFYFNLTAIFIGITLGGNFGIATILNLIAVPVLLHYFIPRLRRYIR